MGRSKNGQRGIREIREGRRAPRQSYGERFAGSTGAGDGGGVEGEGEGGGDGEAENRDPKNEVYVHEPVVSQEDYNILFAKPVFASNNRRGRGKGKSS